MSAEQIYKKTLEQLADAGNPEAKLALMLGKTVTEIDYSAVIATVCNCLHSADLNLGEAMRHNGDKWSIIAVEYARNHIAKALIALANK